MEYFEPATICYGHFEEKEKQIKDLVLERHTATDMIRNELPSQCHITFNGS